MESPAKRVKKEQDKTDCVEGYIHQVTPMKVSTKSGNKYFNALLQEQSTVTHIVGFKERQKDELKQLEIQRSPIRMSNIERPNSYKKPGCFDIKLKQDSNITPTKLSFTFNQVVEPSSSSSPPANASNVKINTVAELPELSKVSLTAKVMEKLQTVNQLVREKTYMDRTICVIADETGTICLTLWGNPDQLSIDSTYSFNSLTVKKFEETTVTTNPSSVIKLTEDINVDSFKSIWDRWQKATITGVKILTEAKCPQCFSLINVNEDVKSVKCHSCKTRLLLTSVIKFSKGTITTNDGKTFSLTAEVMDSFFPGDVQTPDDKEFYILENNDVEFIVLNGNIIALKKNV